MDSHAAACAAGGDPPAVLGALGAGLPGTGGPLSARQLKEEHRHAAETGFCLVGPCHPLVQKLSAEEMLTVAGIFGEPVRVFGHVPHGGVFSR